MKLAKFRKMVAYALSLTMLMSFTPSVAFGETAVAEGTKTFIDMPTNWATAGLEHAVANGLLKGYETAEGLQIRPSGNITRAELVTVVNRAFGATEKAALTGVTDVKNGAWYADEIAKAIGMQTMSKAEKVRPNDSITRQEAFTILARAYRQTGGTRNSFAKFTDSASVADFAVDGVGALVEKGYVNGADGKLNPTGYLTRAEFAKIMDNLTAAYVNTTAAYSQNVTGNVIVNTPGAKLKDMKINGNLIIADGVGEGDVDIENVIITGDMIVKAGGENSIHIISSRIGGTLEVEKRGNAVRIEMRGETKVSVVQVGSNVIINATNLKGGEIGTVKIDGNTVTEVTLSGNFKMVESSVKDVKINANEGKVEYLLMTEKAEVSGSADITSVKNDSDSKVTINGRTIEIGATDGKAATDTPAATGGSTGGGSTSGGGGTGGGSGSGGGGGTTQPTTKYTITVSDTTNGTVTAAKTSNIEAGESVVITITPDANYQLNTITVNGVNKTSSVADGKLTVTVNGNLTVAATFESTSTGTQVPTGFEDCGKFYLKVDYENEKITIIKKNADSEIYGAVFSCGDYETISGGYTKECAISGIYKYDGGYDDENQCPTRTLNASGGGTETALGVFSLFTKDTEEHVVCEGGDNYGGDGISGWPQVYQTDLVIVAKEGNSVAEPFVKRLDYRETSTYTPSETYYPYVTYQGNSLNDAENAIVLRVWEAANEDGTLVVEDGAAGEFIVPEGMTVTGVTKEIITYENGHKNTYLKLAISGTVPEGDFTIDYNGTKIHDVNGDPLKFGSDSYKTTKRVKVELSELAVSEDRESILFKLTGDGEITDYTGFANDVKVYYGTDAENCTLVNAQHGSVYVGNGDSYIYINEKPTEVSGGKYFVDIPLSKVRNFALDSYSDVVKREATILSGHNITPVATWQNFYNRPEAGYLKIKLSDNASDFRNYSYSLRSTGLYEISDGENSYRLRYGGSGWWDNDGTANFTIEASALPFNPDEFNWENARLTYSSGFDWAAARNHYIGLWDEVISAVSGNIITHFEAPITVVE